MTQPFLDLVVINPQLAKSSQHLCQNTNLESKQQTSFSDHLQSVRYKTDIFDHINTNVGRD